VDQTFAAKLYSIGVTTVELFAVFAKDQADLEGLLKEHFEIDTSSIHSRVVAGKITVAWLAARTRSQKQTDQDGDCEVRRVPKDIPNSVSTGMRDAFEKTYWALEDKQVPARSYMERKMDEVEKNELRAEPLEEVVSLEEDDPHALKTEWRPDGQLRAVRVGTKVPLPKGPEELRKRIALMGTALIFAGTQQVHKAYLQGLTPQTFLEYVEYLLGDHVWKLAASGPGNTFISSPSWGLLLSYEHAIRKKMVELQKKGTSVKLALKAAYEDPVTKERYFTTPLCMEAVAPKRTAPTEWPGPEWRPQPQPTVPDSKGKGKGKGKDKGKEAKGGNGQRPGAGQRTKERKRGSAMKGAPKGCTDRTPDGKNICFGFNTKEGCTRAPCPFAHVCGKCFTPNVPIFQCQKCRKS